MVSVAEQHLLREFFDTADVHKREVGYYPTYFFGMIAEHGLAKASSRLIRSEEPSNGFTRLWQSGRLDVTVEAISLLPWYSELFDDEDRAAARRRLKAYRFDLDGFLARRTASPPPWWCV